MRLPWQFSAVRTALAKGWRVPSEHVLGQFNPLVCRPLEERRVLTVAVGAVAALDPSAAVAANPVTTEAPKTDPGVAAAEANGAAKLAQPQGFIAPLSLQVASDQATDEGKALVVNNIGTVANTETPLASVTYSIDWGDGRPPGPGDTGTVTVTVGPTGAPVGVFNGTHTYADNGNYVVTVTVFDGDNSTSDTLNVVVSNLPPTLEVTSNKVIDEGSPLAITDIGKFTDPGFDNPLNVGGETTERFFYAVDWGDGTPLAGGTATIDQTGGVGVLTKGSFDGSHTYADNGLYTVTVTISDDDGGSKTDTFTVRVNNVPPALEVTSNKVIDEGSLLSITDIGKFTDPGFDNPLNVGGEVKESFTYAVDWGDGTPLQAGAATIDQLGGIGTPTKGSFDGSHTYADNGLYTVTVTISDDDGGSTTDTFTVLVNNVAPTLEVTANKVIDEGSLLSITDLGKFTDPGFDNPLNVGGEVRETFTYAVDWGDGTPLQAGAATIDQPGGIGTPTKGSFDGSHTYADNGLYTVTVTISDDDGGSTSDTFTVLVNNVAPTLEVVGGTVDEGSLLTITNIGTFTDPGFDNLLNVGGETKETFTYSIDWGDGTALTAGAATIDQPGQIGATTKGSFDGSHIYADNGLYNVTVTISDDDGGTTAVVVNVIVNNVAPTLVVGGNQTITLETPISRDPIGTYTDPGFDNPLNVGGETTERFTFTIDWGDGTPLSGLPAPITQPGGPGQLTAGAFPGSHIYSAPGTFTVTVTVSDDDGGTAVGQFEVTVNVIRFPDVFQIQGAGAGLASPFFMPPTNGERAQQVQPGINPIEYRRLRMGAVAGAERRLVLRVVSPDGEEDRSNDKPLDNQVLDNLRKLFRRLPDGNYRIYQIQPDGVERLVIDVIVRQGRSIDTADEVDDVTVPHPAAADEPEDSTLPASEQDAASTMPVLETAEEPDAQLAMIAAGLVAWPGRRRWRRTVRRVEDRPPTRLRRLWKRLAP